MGGIEKGHNRLWDKIKADLIKQCIPVKNIGIIILEVFPAEEKESMLSGLKELFERSELPLTMKMEGLLGGTWWQNIGYLMTNVSHGQRDTALPWVKKKALPASVASIQVNLGQSFDFCYYLTFSCAFSSAFQGDVEAAFANSVGPKQTSDVSREEYEPRIRGYQVEIESFLSQFIKGIFLSQKIEKGLRCPSIRVLLADNIDFNNFQNWSDDHFHFLRYLGLDGPCSRLDSYLVSYQPDRLFKEQGIFAGLTFISSLEHYKGKIEHADQETLVYVSDLFQDLLLPFFVVTYWAVSRIELWLVDWESKASDLEKRLRNTFGEGKSFRMVKPVYEDIMQLSIDFEASALREERNISSMKRGIIHAPRPKSEPLPVSGMKMDVLGDVVEGVRFVDEELDHLNFVRRKISSSFDQCKQLTDFALQSGMRNLTIVAVFLGALALVAVLPQLSWMLEWVNSFLK